MVSIQEEELEFYSTEVLLEHIIAGLQEKKGYDIISLDLQNIPNAVTSYFVICTGNTDTQTCALANSVEKLVLERYGEKPWHMEGYQKGEWILMDYVDIVVHIFLPRTRAFYRLDDLWADAERKSWQSLSLNS